MRSRARKRHKVGLPPGSLVHSGERRAENIKIRVIDYDESTLDETQIEDIRECFSFKEKPTVSWINIDGLHDVDIVAHLGAHFGIHPLLQEDILSTRQRPKIEIFDDYAFIVLRMLSHVNGKIEDEQGTLVIGTNFLLSFQEREGKVFDSVRARIRSGKGRIRRMGPDYLGHALVDAIVDDYFVFLEKLGDDMETLSEGLIDNPTVDQLHEIYQLRNTVIGIRKSVWPLREVIGGLQRAESVWLNETTLPYLRDVYDHTIQVIDTVETLRDTTSGMLDLYLSTVSHKMNEVMKVLTIIATIFIPLTFIAGIYGMNFEYMPELGWRWGYFGTLFGMLLVGVLMLLHFRRKKWL